MVWLVGSDNTVVFRFIPPVSGGSWSDGCAGFLLFFPLFPFLPSSGCYKAWPFRGRAPGSALGQSSVCEILRQQNTSLSTGKNEAVDSSPPVEGLWDLGASLPLSHTGSREGKHGQWWLGAPLALLSLMAE